MLHPKDVERMNSVEKAHISTPSPDLLRELLCARTALTLSSPLGLLGRRCMSLGTNLEDILLILSRRERTLRIYSLHHLRHHLLLLDHSN